MSQNRNVHWQMGTVERETDGEDEREGGSSLLQHLQNPGPRQGRRARCRRRGRRRRKTGMTRRESQSGEGGINIVWHMDGYLWIFD